MNFIVWLILGGMMGWLASIVMETNAPQGVFSNVVVGVVGAMFGGGLVSPMIGVGTFNLGNVDLEAMSLSICGAAILLAVVSLVRRNSAR